MLKVGDSLELLATLDECSVDAVVTDPPYGIHFMGQEWDRPRAVRVAKSQVVKNLGVGMRHTTLTEDRQFQAWTEQWAREALRVLKPGAYLLAMGATRLYHRTACGIQDAGFECRDCLAFLYGSGFPKSSNFTPSWSRQQRPDWYMEATGLPQLPKGQAVPPGPLGTALKPAWEPIVLARKPLEGTAAETFERYGTGYLDIDDARVPLAAGDEVPEFEQNPERDGAGLPGTSQADHVTGRWPANVAHDGSEEVKGELPHTVSGYTMPWHKQARSPDSIFPFGPVGEGGYRGDLQGNAGRFFYTAKPSRHEKEAGLDHLPVYKPHEVQGRAEGSAGSQNPRAGVGGDPGALARRCHHPTVKPIELFRWLIRLACPRGGIVLDPFAGSGTTAIAALLEDRRWIAIEREPDYHALAQARIAFWAREHARKPGRSVAEILGEAPRPNRAQKPAEGPQQGDLGL